MVSKLRPAVEVLRDASNALLPPIRGEWASILRMQEKAAAVIEADRPPSHRRTRTGVAGIRPSRLRGKNITGN